MKKNNTQDIEFLEHPVVKRKVKCFNFLRYNIYLSLDINQACQNWSIVWSKGVFTEKKQREDVYQKNKEKQRSIRLRKECL